ncbi:hypothetical protein [Massilia sp.]|uniref:hypothetical protein n=1 Tax=Massilia sp. TaxID=1882437 RepID=UPI0028AA5612|nr:hypothetical protein [Massilia sp.]
MHKPRFFLALGSALLLSACGGGGGSSGTTTNPGPVSTLSPITASNATKVAANAYVAASAIDDSSSSLGDLLTGVSVARSNISTVRPVLDLVKRAYTRDATPLLTGVSVSEACSGGGSITIEANLRNQQTVSNGDSIVMMANRCIEDGEMMNGTFKATFSNVTGDVLNSWIWSATVDTRFENFSIASGSETLSVNGDMKIAINQTSASNSSLTVSGNSLQTTEQRSGTTVAARTLSDFSMNSSNRSGTVTSAANFAMSGNTGGLGQFSYTVRNIQPFVTVGASMPSSGALVVTGATTAVTLTAVNASGVRLDLSDKASGAVTQTTTVSWLDLLLSF